MTSKTPNDVPGQIFEAAARNGNGHHAPSVLPDTPPVLRLYNRTSNPHKADFPVGAIERDAAEIARRRALSEAYPLTDADNVRKSYQAALAIIRQHLPLRSAVLDDLAGRIEIGLARFRELRREVEQEDQQYNEESRRGDAWIDERVGKLRAERALETAQADKEIVDLTERLDGFRKEIAESRVRAGLPVPLWDLIGDDPDTARLEAVVENKRIEGEVTGAVSNVPIASIAGQSMRPLMKLVDRFIPQIFRGHMPPNAAPEAVDKAVAPTPAASFEQTLLAGTADESAHEREFDPPRHWRVEFPLAEAQEQAQPLESVAIAHGLLYESPAASNMDDGPTRVLRFLKVLSLAACGSIFGLSLGVIVGVLDVRMISIRPLATVVPASIVAVLGISIFWVLGRIVTGIFGLWSEERHLAMLNRSAGKPVEVGNWLGRSAWITGAVAVLASIVLIVIESQVERYGVLSVFLDRSRNAGIAAGHIGGATNHGPDTLAILCLVLMVSLPFILIHAVDAWIEVRRKTFNKRLNDIQTTEAHKSARELQQKRLHVLETAYAEWQEQRSAAMKGTLPHPNMATVLDSLEPVREQEPSVPIEMTSDLAGANDAGDGALSQANDGEGVPTVSVSGKLVIETNTLSVKSPPRGLTVEEIEARVRLSVCSQQARDAYYRRRVMMAKRNEVATWFTDGIARLEGLRRSERTDMDASNKARIEDAYADYAGAVRAFDEAYKREMIALETLAKGGWLFRLRAWMLRQPLRLE